MDKIKVGTHIIAVLDDGEKEAEVLHVSSDTCQFLLACRLVDTNELVWVREYKEKPKEMSSKQKLLNIWCRQSLDFAYDTLSSTYSLEEVFDFMLEKNLVDTYKLNVSAFK